MENVCGPEGRSHSFISYYIMQICEPRVEISAVNKQIPTVDVLAKILNVYDAIANLNDVLFSYY